MKQAGKFFTAPVIGIAFVRICALLSLLGTYTCCKFVRLLEYFLLYTVQLIITRSII